MHGEFNKAGVIKDVFLISVSNCTYDIDSNKIIENYKI